jgi:hypothetical protein
MIFYNYSKWTPMLLQIISQGSLFQLLVLPGFWLLPNLLEAFGQLWCVRSCIGEQMIIFIILGCFFYSLVISSIWCGNQRWVQNDGSWWQSCFKHPSWLGGVGGGHCKCFQQHFLNSHLSRVNSHDKKPIVLTFPFCFIFLCLASSLQFQPPFLFGRVMCHSFFVGHGDSFG